MTDNYCMELLRCAMEQTKPSSKLIDTISLSDLYDFSCLNKLIPLTVNMLSLFKPVSDDEKQLVKFWREEAAGLVFLEYRRLALVKNLIKLADERKLSLTFFKGYLLANLYPDFALRNSSDTDILIEASQLTKIRSLLEELNYSHQNSSDTENVYTYVYAESGVPVHKIEVHTSLHENMQGWQLSYFESLNLSSPAKNISVKCCGTSFTTLNYKEHFIYQIFHMAKHLCCHGFPARYLIDTALFIKAYHKLIDWFEINHIMNRLGYSHFCRQLYSILIRYLAAPSCILCGEPLCSEEEFHDLLHDILHFGARAYSQKLSHYFFFFEQYIEKLEEKAKCLLSSITFDGNTVPLKIVPLEYQKNKTLQHRITLLQKLNLI